MADRETRHRLDRRTSIVLPSVPWLEGIGGGRIRAVGITGSIRGMKVKGNDGGISPFPSLAVYFGIPRPIVRHGRSAKLPPGETGQRRERMDRFGMVLLTCSNRYDNDPPGL